VATVPTRGLGLADWIRSARDVHETAFALDRGVAERVRAALVGLADQDDPAYWLELPSPRGYLHLIPWERLLSSMLDRPLLRLPNFTLRPYAPGPSLRVVLAAGRAPSKPEFPVAEVVEQLTLLWLESTRRKVLVEVFVDAADVGAVRDRLGDHAGVTVHDPDRAHVSASTVPQNGWIAWVGAALVGKATDVVHLVGQGTLVGERGALALPSITSRGPAAGWSGTLGTVELCGALGRIGAWSLMISAPPDNHCPAGLRDLADAVAQARPGVVALHELDGGGAADQMRRALQMIYDGTPPYRPLPGVICWSHPSFVAFPDFDVPLCSSDGTSALIADATHEVLSQVDTPAWVAAGARTLETLQARVIPTDGQPADPQAIAALQAVSELFEEHVRAFALPEASGRGTTS